jgi:hypothetical protein
MRRQAGRGDVSENRIAFQFGDREQWAEALDDNLQQVAENAVGVREFYSRQVGGVARDVREDEVTVLGGGFDPCILSDAPLSRGYSVVMGRHCNKYNSPPA